MTEQTYDVVIIGGGLAGLSAANHLCSVSQGGLSVCLVDYRGVGRNKTGRMVFSDTVKEYHLEEAVEKYYPCFVFHAPSGATARFNYDYPTLASLDYSKACQILLERASRQGLRIMTARALSFTPNPPRKDEAIQVLLSNGTCIQTEVILDASGPQQWAARCLGIGLSPYFSVCYGERLRGSIFEDENACRLLCSSPQYGNGGGWFYPLQDHQASFGYAVLVERGQTRRHLLQGYQLARSNFSPYAEWVRTAKRERVEGGEIPVGRISRFTDNRLLIAGDAAGQVYPWTVMGCATALVNGERAARTFYQAFEKGHFERQFLGAYERGWVKENGERFFRAASLMELDWHQPDTYWDEMVRKYQSLPKEKQLALFKEYRVPWYAQAYALAGYLRRGLVSRLRNWTKD